MTSKNTAATWGKEPHGLLTLTEAWGAVAADVIPVGMTSVALRDAVGRILARPVTAQLDDPAFDKAVMDGFAVRSTDCEAPGAVLGVVGLAAAGDAPANELGAMLAVRINTGAPVPPGADAIVKVEDTTPSTDGLTVRINTVARPGQHITPQGDIKHQGDVVLSAPIRLEAAQIAAAAAGGADHVEVYEPLRAAVVTTGNELVPIGKPRKPGQITETNGPMLAALLRRFGAEPDEPVIACDKTDDLKRLLGQALARPVVLAVGGMSMGTLDLVPQVFEELGVRWAFHGVSLKPGKPVAYGRGPDGQHVFGLPGNPVSAFVCAWLFVRMVVRGLQGFLPAAPPPRWRATLAGPIEPSRDPRPLFVPARVWNDAEQGMIAEPCKWHGSSDLFALADANALLFRPTPTKAAEAGDPVDVILMTDAAQA